MPKKDCVTEKVYIDNSADLEKVFINGVYIFGTGVDAESASNALCHAGVAVKGFLDSYRYLKGSKFQNREIFPATALEEGKHRFSMILIATYRYAYEVLEQVVALGYFPGRDVFIWDEKCLFHKDRATKDYIEFLKKIWQPEKQRIYDKKTVVIPFDNRHDLMSAIYSYCSNYFAQKENARICAYFRGGSDTENASAIIKEIYESFRVDELIDTKLTEEKCKEAVQITEDLWAKLYTWEDWKNITIYGIRFGTTLVRDYLRRFIPSYEMRDEKIHQFLRSRVEMIVFWYDYYQNNDVCVTLLADGVSWDGYIRDISLFNGIPTYALCYKMAKCFPNFCDRPQYQYFDKYWSQLSEDEKTFGLQWAQKQIEKRLNGGTDEVYCTNKNNFTFAEKKKDYRILKKSDKIKILICPHIFEEDSFWCGEQIFDDNYFSWLTHLGDLARKHPEYDWYLKMHPFASRRDFIILHDFIARNADITLIDSAISPLQLKEEGISYALTVYGTIGHEYPEIGIQVINAGLNPHSKYGFTWNPKTKEEYDGLFDRLPELDPLEDKEGLLRFYSLNYLFYDWSYISQAELFFINPELAMDPLELKANGKNDGTWKYKAYMDEWTETRHQRICESMEEVFQKLDKWSPEVLYRREDISKALEKWKKQTEAL